MWYSNQTEKLNDKQKISQRNVLDSLEFQKFEAYFKWKLQKAKKSNMLAVQYLNMLKTNIQPIWLKFLDNQKT